MTFCPSGMNCFQDNILGKCLLFSSWLLLGWGKTTFVRSFVLWRRSEGIAGLNTTDDLEMEQRSMRHIGLHSLRLIYIFSIQVTNKKVGMSSPRTRRIWRCASLSSPTVPISRNLFLFRDCLHQGVVRRGAVLRGWSVRRFEHRR